MLFWRIARPDDHVSPQESESNSRSDAGYINQHTILTTNYSSTGGRKSGSDGAHASATAADAPNLEPTAASRSRAALAGDSING